MSDVLHASITGDYGRIERFFSEATLEDFDDYEKAYVNIGDGEVRIVSSIPGASASSYSTATDEFFDDIEVGDVEGGTAEALIDVDDFFFYLGMVGGQDGLKLEFRGEADSRLATTCEMKGDLNSRHFLPASENTLEQLPLWLISEGRFDENDVYGPADRDAHPGKVLDTTIQTTVETVERIIDAVDEDQTDLDKYPIVVEDGEFHFSVKDERDRGSVWGTIRDAEVDGEDVATLYNKGFKPVFDHLSGDVRLNTTPAPEGAPLCVVKYPSPGVTLRHVVGPSGTLDE